jgi:hypothetical protein
MPSADEGMPSFSDLALPDVAPEEPPVVEADVVAAEPAPPVSPELTPDEPLLPPPVGGPAIQRDALVPPRRRGDDPEQDKDDFSHVLGNDGRVK